MKNMIIKIKKVYVENSDSLFSEILLGGLLFNTLLHQLKNL